MQQENIETDAVRIETFYGWGDYSQIDAVELVGLAPGIYIILAARVNNYRELTMNDKYPLKSHENQYCNYCFGTLQHP